MIPPGRQNRGNPSIRFAEPERPAAARKGKAVIRKRTPAPNLPQPEPPQSAQPDEDDAPTESPSESDPGSDREGDLDTQTEDTARRNAQEKARAVVARDMRERSPVRRPQSKRPRTSRQVFQNQEIRYTTEITFSVQGKEKHSRLAGSVKDWTNADFYSLRDEYLDSLDRTRCFTVPGVFRSTSFTTINVTATGMKDPMSVTLTDLDDLESNHYWEKVHNIVELLADEGRKHIRVRLHDDYEFVPHQQPSPIASQMAASQAIPAVTPSQSARKRGQTTSVGAAKVANLNALQQMTEEMTGSSLFRINLRWQCHDKHCPNYKHVCLVVPRRGHYRLANEDLRRWDLAISEKRTTEEVCPPEVAMDAMKRAEKGPVKKAAKQQAIQEPGLPSYPQIMPIPIPMFGSPGGPQWPQYQQYIPESSPPRLGDDDLGHAYRYLRWLEDRKLILMTHMGNAYKGTKENGYGFEHFRKISDAEWDSWQVPRGARLHIIGKQKEYVAHCNMAIAAEAAANARRAVEEADRPGVEESNEAGPSRQPERPSNSPLFLSDDSDFIAAPE